MLEKLGAEPTARDFVAMFRNWLICTGSAKASDPVASGGYAVAFHGAPRFTGDLDHMRASGERPRGAGEVRLFGARDCGAGFIS
jgi:hypothetical protein